MARAVTFTIDRSAFTAALRKYVPLSKRTPAEVCNRKAYFISRRALWYTPKADKYKIAEELGSLRRGRVKLATRTRYTRYGKTYEAPFVALILNARAKPGEGLYGARMAEAIKRFLQARMRSIGFLKSGFLGAIRTLAGYVRGTSGAPPVDRSVAANRTLGSAIPAQGDSWSASATIINTASSKHDEKGALLKYAGPALQQAFDEEALSTMEEVEKRLKKAADEAGIKHD